MPVKALYFLGDFVSCCRFVIGEEENFVGHSFRNFQKEHEAIMDALATRSSARALLTRFMDRMGVKHAPHLFRLSQGAPTGGAI